MARRHDYDRFPATHYPVARAYLVAVLGVYLVKRNGELAVTGKLIPHKGGKGFFRSRGHDKICAQAVLCPEQGIAYAVPAPGFFPEFSGYNHGWFYFQGTDGIHFFADDLLHLSEGKQAQK
jgi:hypothetical protein